MKITTEIFIQRARSIHGESYDYSNTVYTNCVSKLRIDCKEHGAFYQFPHNHTLAGTGCPTCKKEQVDKIVPIQKRKKKDYSKNIPLKQEIKQLHTPYIAEGAVIPLPNGRYTIVDLEDVERVIVHKWVYQAGYIVNVDGTAPTRQLHRFVMGLESSLVGIDHRNRIKADNRKCNLRECTDQQNSRNSPPRKNKSSVFKGIYFDKRCNKWLAKIAVNHKQTYIGIYADEITAAKAYDEKAKELFGEFAYLNFPL